jgi:hypothetical protein
MVPITSVDAGLPFEKLRDDELETLGPRMSPSEHRMIYDSTARIAVR